MTVKYCCSGIVGEAITIVTVTAKKVIKAAVMHLTNIKSKLLNCEYKANWEGIPVMFVNEAYTSQLCWRCGSAGKRKK